MNERGLVADASAILAWLRQEPFRGFDPEQLIGATISAVNLSEVLEKLCSGGMSPAAADSAAAALGLEVVAFDEAQARIAAGFRPLTRSAGLSLADRACLALGLYLGRRVATGDRIWAGLDLSVKVVLIR